MKRLLIALAACTPLPAYAEALVNQVERPEIDVGESEWELLAIHAARVHDDASVTELELQYAYGVNAHWEVGFEIDGEREGADGFVGESVALQTKLVWADPEEQRIGAGAQFTLGRSLHGAETTAELRLLNEIRFGEALAAASDIRLSNTLEGEATHEVALDYAARLDWSQSWGALALEAGGQWGALDDLRWSSEDRHWLGPAARFEALGLEIEAAAFAGLTAATPDTQVRLQFALR